MPTILSKSGGVGRDLARSFVQRRRDAEFASRRRAQSRMAIAAESERLRGVEVEMEMGIEDEHDALDDDGGVEEERSGISDSIEDEFIHRPRGLKSQKTDDDAAAPHMLHSYCAPRSAMMGCMPPLKLLTIEGSRRAVAAAALAKNAADKDYATYAKKKKKKEKKKKKKKKEKRVNDEASSSLAIRKRETVVVSSGEGGSTSPITVDRACSPIHALDIKSAAPKPQHGDESVEKGVPVQVSSSMQRISQVHIHRTGSMDVTYSDGEMGAAVAEAEEENVDVAGGDAAAPSEKGSEDSEDYKDDFEGEEENNGSNMGPDLILEGASLGFGLGERIEFASEEAERLSAPMPDDTVRVLRQIEQERSATLRAMSDCSDAELQHSRSAELHLVSRGASLHRRADLLAESVDGGHPLASALKRDVDRSLSSMFDLASSDAPSKSQLPAGAKNTFSENVSDNVRYSAERIRAGIPDIRRWNDSFDEEDDEATELRKSVDAIRDLLKQVEREMEAAQVQDTDGDAHALEIFLEDAVDEEIASVGRLVYRSSTRRRSAPSSPVAKAQQQRRLSRSNALIKRALDTAMAL